MTKATNVSPRCPTCRREVALDDEPYRPFCSARCKLLDLGGWLTEKHRIPGEERARDDHEEDGDE